MNDMTLRDPNTIRYTCLTRGVPNGPYRSTYVRIAIVCHDAEYTPTRIDDRIRAIHRIHYLTNRVHYGDTHKSRGRQIEEQARETARRLNEAVDYATACGALWDDQHGRAVPRWPTTEVTR